MGTGDMDTNIDAPIKESQGDRFECEACVARACGMCSILTESQISALRVMTRTREYQAGEPIFCDEEPSHQFFAVRSGIVKLSKILPDGRQQTIGLNFAPDFIGQVYTDTNRYFAHAVTDVKVCSFPPQKFESFLSETPSLEHRLFKLTLDELDTARNWMLMLGSKTAIEKLATLLLKLAERMYLASCLNGQMSKRYEFELLLSRTEIADFLGLKIETVSRQFTVLKKEKLIEIENQRFIKIVDVPGMKDLAAIRESD